jgi:hypothetical protein
MNVADRQLVLFKVERAHRLFPFVDQGGLAL